MDARSAGPTSYDVTQYLNGEFKPIEVWDREDANHTLMFKNVLVQDSDGTEAEETGYKFAADFRTVNEDDTDLDWVRGNPPGTPPDPKVPMVTDHRSIPPIGPTNPGTAPKVTGDDPLDPGLDETLAHVAVRHYYKVETDGPVAVWKPKTVGFHELVGAGMIQPKILLRVTGAGPATGTVTITYYLLVDRDGNEYLTATGVPDPTDPLRDSTAENADNMWIMKSETLTVNVKASRSSN